MIRITEASFLTSASMIEEAMPQGLSEVAFIGRSNVGKSSLINALVSRHGLAKSSSTPGKTRLINHFGVSFEKEGETYRVVFVDLPGFGYARVSKSLKEAWEKELNRYLMQRLSLRLFVQLIDGRHPLLEIDQGVEAYIKGILRPDQALLRLYTKADKLTQSQISLIRKQDPHAIIVSSSSKKNIDTAREAIFNHLFGVAQ